MENQAWFDEMEARIPKGEVRTRFAPSPTGYMHIGNLRTALYTYLIARRLGGKFILRIEDTDQERFIEGATDVIYNTLRTCKLDWQEGPDIGGPVGPYIQTQRREIYGKYADLLVEKGGAYRCFCKEDEGTVPVTLPNGEVIKKHQCGCGALTAEQIQEKLDAGETCVVRQKIPQEGTTTFVDSVFGEITVPNNELDENVLIKTDGLPTYNFANVIDDHLMGITHVVRGSEYLSSSPKYNLLYQAFGWEVPAYVHCSPVMRDSQHKMSKRHGDPSFEDLVEQGYLPEAVLNYVALLGWSPGGEQEIFSLQELAQVFDIGGISKSPAVFDINKLKWMNAEYIKAMPPEDFARAAEPYIRRMVKNPAIDTGRVAGLLQQRTELLTEIPEKVDFFDALDDYDLALYEHKKSKVDRAISLDVLKAALPALEALPAWTDEAIHDTLIALAEARGAKNALVMYPVRIAVSGRAVTPGGAVEICSILGKDEALARLRTGIARLEAGM